MRTDGIAKWRCGVEKEHFVGKRGCSAQKGLLYSDLAEFHSAYWLDCIATCRKIL